MIKKLSILIILLLLAVTCLGNDSTADEIKFKNIIIENDIKVNCMRKLTECKGVIQLYLIEDKITFDSFMQFCVKFGRTAINNPKWLNEIENKKR